jgi:hypothetical protein
MLNMNLTTQTCIEKHDEMSSGFIFIPGNDMPLPVGRQPAWRSLSETWASLPEDPYASAHKLARHRRYGRVLYCGDPDNIRPLPHTAFLQSATSNRLFGGVQRKFQPLLDSTYENDCLRWIIDFDSGHFWRRQVPPTSAWTVGIHQIRVIALPGQPGHPTPEGIHQDGTHFVAVHLVKRGNVNGGVSEIYDSHKQPLAQVALLEPLDSMILDDRRVFHAVTSIEVRNPTLPAVRDVLILTYDPY